MPVSERLRTQPFRDQGNTGDDAGAAYSRHPGDSWKAVEQWRSNIRGGGGLSRVVLTPTPGETAGGCGLARGADIGLAWNAIHSVKRSHASTFPQDDEVGSPF